MFSLYTDCYFLINFPAKAQVITPDSVDRLVERTLKTFDVPDVAAAIVKDDKIVYARGYGVSSLNTDKKVNENTLLG